MAPPGEGYERNLPATLTLDILRLADGERGHLVVVVGEDDVVRAWVARSEHPRTGEEVEASILIVC